MITDADEKREHLKRQRIRPFNAKRENLHRDTRPGERLKHGAENGLGAEHGVLQTPARQKWRIHQPSPLTMVKKSTFVAAACRLARARRSCCALTSGVTTVAITI